MEDHTTPRRQLRYSAVTPATSTAAPSTSRRSTRSQGLESSGRGTGRRSTRGRSSERTPSKRTPGLRTLVDAPGTGQSPSASIVDSAHAPPAVSGTSKRSKSSPPRVGGRTYSKEVLNQYKLMLQDLYRAKLLNDVDRQELTIEQEKDDGILQEKMEHIDNTRLELQCLEKDLETSQKEYEEKYNDPNRKDVVAKKNNVRDLINQQISVLIMKMSSILTVEDCEAVIAESRGAIHKARGSDSNTNIKFSHLENIEEAQHYAVLESTEDVKDFEKEDFDATYGILRGPKNPTFDKTDPLSLAYPFSLRLSRAYVQNLTGKVGHCKVHDYYLGTWDEALFFYVSDKWRGGKGENRLKVGFRRMRLALHLGLSWDTPDPTDIDPKMPAYIQEAYKKARKARLGLAEDEYDDHSDSDEDSDGGGLEDIH